MEPENTEDLEIIPGGDYCTLITCTPYAINTHRMLVRVARVPYTGEDEQPDTPQTVQYQQLNNAIDRDAAGEADDIGTSYVDMLDVGESLGYITIPKIDVNLPIYEGTSDDVLVKGVGHLEGSSYPLGGAGTHSVLTGHRGLAEAVLFTDLDKLGEGDRFYLHMMDEVLA